MTARDAGVRHALLAGAMLAVGTLRAAGADDPLANYYDNTLIWQNPATHAIGRLWLERDGHYFAFYNVGAQSQPATPDGPFQVQGREGTYTLRTAGSGWRLCLWPAAPRIRIGAEGQRELYAGADCYLFSPHAVGDSWTESADSAGRDYRFWLARGR